MNERDGFNKPPPWLGPTNSFPNGKISESDEGALILGISVTETGLVQIDFGIAVEWLALNKAQATELAKTLLDVAGVKLTIET